MLVQTSKLLAPKQQSKFAFPNQHSFPANFFQSSPCLPLWMKVLITIKEILWIQNLPSFMISEKISGKQKVIKTHRNGLFETFVFFQFDFLRAHRKPFIPLKFFH